MNPTGTAGRTKKNQLSIAEFFDPTLDIPNSLFLEDLGVERCERLGEGMGDLLQWEGWSDGAGIQLGFRSAHMRRFVQFWPSSMTPF